MYFTKAIHHGTRDLGLSLFLILTSTRTGASLFQYLPTFGSVLQTPLVGSATALRCSLDASLGKKGESGKYWYVRTTSAPCDSHLIATRSSVQEKAPSAIAQDPTSCDKLWVFTEGLIEKKWGKSVDDIVTEVSA